MKPNCVIRFTLPRDRLGENRKTPLVERNNRPPCLLACLMIAMALTLSAQERPGLLFREDWKETPAATPVTQEHVANANLIVTRYGPAAAQIKKSHHDKPADDPFYIWSGDAERNWAITLRPKNAFIDLTGQSKIRWRARQTGFRQLRIILKLANGKWVVSDQF